MASADQTPGGYKFAPLVAGQQGRANQHKPACFGLSSPWSFPSRSGIRLHDVVQPWLPLQRSISPRNVPSLVPPCCHPIYSGRRSCGRTSRGHTGGRSHRNSPPSFCGTCLNFSREKESASFSLVDREVEFCVVFFGAIFFLL